MPNFSIGESICAGASRPQYAPAPTILNYYSNIKFLVDSNTLVLCVAVDEHAIFCVVSFITTAVYVVCCPASGDGLKVEYRSQSRTILLLLQDMSDFPQDIGLIEILHCFPLTIPSGVHDNLSDC